VRVYNPGSNEEYDVNVVVSRNTFDGNTYGVSAYSTLSMNTASGQAYVNLDVSGNTFSDNTYGVYIYDNPTSPVVNGVPSTVVSRYDIYGNTVVNGTYGLYYLGYTDSNSADATLSSQVYIYSNTIISSERGIFVFAYTLSDSANSTSTVYASVTGNTIQDPYANMNNGIYVYVYISDTDPYASTVNVNYEISGNSITMADNNYGIYASMNSSGRGSNIVTLGISSNAISHTDYGIYIDYRNSDNVTEYVSIDDNTITQMVWSGVHITEIDMSTSSYTISGNTITYCYRGVYVYATNSIYISSTGLYGNVINYNTYGMYLYSPGTTTLSLSQNANDFDSNQFGVYVRGDMSATVSMRSESFWNESYAAVYVYSNGDAYVDVLSSAFSTVGRGVFITADYAYIDISSNTMNDVTYAGIYVTVSVFSTGTISHNTLSNCLRYGIYAERGDMLDISHNAITDSVWYSGYAAIYVYLGTYTIGYNTLQNNGYMGIYITTTSYVALEYNTVVNTGVYRYGSEWGVYVTNCANLSSMGNDVYDNQNGYYITGTEFAMTGDSVRSNDGYGIYVVNSRGDLINCYIADNIYEGLYAPSSSDVNIYADGGQFTVYNDDIFFYGNLTVRNGGEMVTTYGYVYLGSVANNEVGIYVESDGTLNAFDSYIGSWTGYYYLFRIYGQATIQGTTIDDVYAVEVYSIINFLESEVVDAWYAGIVVNINGLVIEASSFRNCNIGVLVNGYTLTIRGGYFNYNEIGLEAINANLTLIGVRFHYSDDSGVYISGGTATITSAYFYGNDRALYVESAEVTIDDAQFSYNDYGIYATNSVLSVVQPYFSGNTYGIMATGNSTVDVDDGSLYDVLSVYARETSTVNLVRCDLDTKTLLATENAIINVLDDVDISVVNYDGTPVEGAYVEFNGTFGKYNATLPEGDAAILIMFGRATSSGWEDANYTITYTNGYITRTEEWDGSTSLSLVLNRYAPSVVAPAEPVRAVEGQQVQFPFVLDDVDIEYGDVMNYEILYAPDGLSVANGTITWTPTSDYAGTTAYVTFRVTDSGGASTVATVYIYVEPVNDAPQIQNILASQTDDGYVQFLVLCSDPDGDMLNATLLIDDTTAVPLTPAGPAEDGYYYTAKVKLSEGKHTYRVIVSDGENVVSSEQKTLDIPINLMPYIALIALIVAAGLILFLLLKRRREGGEEQTYSEGYIEQETVEDEEISEEAVEE
jgi:parallel beta-helix repeat protein